MLQVGDVIGGRLRIERMLGMGGFGVVAAATHLELRHEVAIKMIRPEFTDDAEIIDRFLREARAVAGLRTEHVCRVHDIGRTEQGAPYIVMELLKGADIASMLKTKPLPPATAVDFALQVCLALAEAHPRGIVHRDLKPPNLFVVRRPDGSQLVKVLDFGLAKAADELRLTHSSIVLGSPQYMSPEQLTTPRDVDARTDIWSLGVTLYHMVARRLPFPSAQMGELAVMITRRAPVPLEEPHIDPGLRAVIFKCLEKDRAARFHDVSQLAAALAPFGGPTAQRAPNVPAVMTAPAAPPGMAQSTPPAMPSAPHAAMPDASASMSMPGAPVTVPMRPPGAAALHPPGASPHPVGPPMHSAGPPMHPPAGAPMHHAPGGAPMHHAPGAAPMHAPSAASMHAPSAAPMHPAGASTHPAGAPMHPPSTAPVHAPGTAPMPPGVSPASSSKSRAFVAGALAVVIVGAGGVLGYFALSSKKSGSSSATKPVEAAVARDAAVASTSTSTSTVDASVAVGAAPTAPDQQQRAVFERELLRLEGRIDATPKTSEDMPNLYMSAIQMACIIRDTGKAKLYFGKLVDEDKQRRAIDTCNAYGVKL